MKPRSPEYIEYLDSREWYLLRIQIRRRARGKCERCKVAAGIEVHHLHYNNLGCEALEDLVLLCKACHGAADRERAIRTIQKEWTNRFQGWAEKVFGDDELAWPEDAEDRFERWLDRQGDRQ